MLTVFICFYTSSIEINSFVKKINVKHLGKQASVCLDFLTR